MLSKSSRPGRAIATTAALTALGAIGFAGPAAAAPAAPTVKACTLKAFVPYENGKDMWGTVSANNCGGKWDKVTVILWAGNPAPGGVQWWAQDSESKKVGSSVSTWPATKRCSAPLMYRTEVLASKGGALVKTLNSSAISMGKC
ncbi:hypothetical protein [Streptomyces sp. NPDC053427]|uniref:hypothetical protein n=1 Tax=Streptomyces sp. NPDC053427 TaxID=3365701 RepID=UPI0037D4EAFD